MKTVNFTYGIGFVRHRDSFEVDDECTEEEIEQMVQDVVMEKLDWGFEVVEE